jgi:arylsulfatase A-like enzyme
MRARSLCLFAWPAVALVAAASSAAEARKPNIILIFSDDYGTPGVGCYGGVYKTPHLDALAAGGIRFTHCYSMPLCGPSRGVTMSGRYPFRNGVLTNGHGNNYKPSDSPPIAVTMKTAGYATAVAGKWRQLSYFDNMDDARAWGYDEFMVWGVGGTAKGERYWDPGYNHNGKPVDHQGKYGPDLLHEFVVDFIRRHRDEPFFVYYPTPLIHSPILRTPDSDAKDKGKHYADNVEYLDKLVGKLVAELDDLKLRENTLVVFTGDNGSTGSGSFKVDGKEIDGKKGSLLEGGSNVPLIANWKGVTPAGKVLDAPVDFSDFYATFAELGGAKLPEGVTFDGRSFAPQLRGETGTPREWAFVQLGNQWYARSQDWKLDQSGTLYSMKNAPHEQITVKDASDGAAKAARATLQAALDELKPAEGKSDAKPGKKLRKKAKKATAE